jgi:hypothetical protein
MTFGSECIIYLLWLAAKTAADDTQRSDARDLAEGGIGKRAIGRRLKIAR